MQSLQQWENNKYYIFIVCVCSLRYPAPEANAPYYIVMLLVSYYRIFNLYLIKYTIL